MTATAYRHIEHDVDGVPIIAGANVKVVEIVAEHLAYRWDAEKLQSEHPHLTLAEIHSALAYYYDHQKQLEQDIDQRLAKSDQTISSLGQSAVRRKLEASKPNP